MLIPSCTQRSRKSGVVISRSLLRGFFWTLPRSAHCHTVVQHMADMTLVAIELEQECEMLQFYIGVLCQHTITIQFLVHDLCEETLRDQGNFQITLVSGVVIHDIVSDVVRLKRFDLAVGIHRQTDCAWDADRLRIGDTAIFVKGCLGIMAVLQAKFDLIAFLRHSVPPNKIVLCLAYTVSSYRTSYIFSVSIQTSLFS